MPQDNFLTTLSQWCSIGHIARETIQFLKNNNVNFTDKEEWMPKPQELPRWISVCGNSQAPLQKRYVNTFLGHIYKLKRMNGINLNIKN